MQTLDEGENFRLLLHGTIAVFQVWARPDVTPEEGARFAGIAMNTLRGLLGDADLHVVGLVIDIRLAPGRVGPTTEAQLGDVFRSWASAGRWVTVLAADPPVEAQLREVLATVAPGRSLATSDEHAAYAFAAAGCAQG